CYGPATGGWKLYSSIRLTARALLSLSVAGNDGGQATVAVIGLPKVLAAVGGGLGAGDEARWVSGYASSDAECDAATVSATAPSAVAVQAAANVTTAIKSATLSVTFVFSSFTAPPSDLALCWRHGAEPFRLYPAVIMRVWTLTGASQPVAKLRTKMIAVAGADARVSFEGVGISAGDRAKWVVAVTPPTAAAGLITLTQEDCATAPAALGSAVTTVADSRGSAVFRFTAATATAGTAMALCYGFGGERFQAYPSITMRSIAPALTAVDASYVIVGRPHQLRLTGTFGFTAPDFVKLVPNAAECTASGM
ncbi:unnamed protein product, partial [Phaeothamnion confervicola]